MTENERINVLRKSLKLTMEAFGEKVGVGKSTISQIESGRSSVTRQMRSSIIREFHVSEAWISDGVGPMFAEQTDTQRIAEMFGQILSDPNSSTYRMAEALAKLSQDEREALFDNFDRLIQAYRDKNNP